jgi:hypothetical protein
MNADGAAPASSTGWAPAGALCGQGPVPHRLRSIARGREALLRGTRPAPRALLHGAASAPRPRLPRPRPPRPPRLHLATDAPTIHARRPRPRAGVWVCRVLRRGARHARAARVRVRVRRPRRARDGPPAPACRRRRCGLHYTPHPPPRADRARCVPRCTPGHTILRSPRSFPLNTLTAVCVSCARQGPRGSSSSASWSSRRPRGTPPCRQCPPLSLLLFTPTRLPTVVQHVVQRGDHGISYHGSSYHGSPYHGSSYHGSSYHGSPYHGSSYHGSSY